MDSPAGATRTLHAEAAPYDETVVNGVTDLVDRDFEDISRESVKDLVVAAFRSYDTATVRTYVALLVERDVRRALKTRSRKKPWHEGGTRRSGTRVPMEE